MPQDPKDQGKKPPLGDLLPRTLEDERAEERSDTEQGERPPRGRD
jgi:hypothetical protein